MVLRRSSVGHTRSDWTWGMLEWAASGEYRLYWPVFQFHSSNFILTVVLGGGGGLRVWVLGGFEAQMRADIVCGRAMRWTWLLGRS
jgi:hypothetical protein